MNIALQKVHNQYGDKLVAGQSIKLYTNIITENLKSTENNLIIYIKSNLVGLTDDKLNQILLSKKRKEDLICVFNQETVLLITNHILPDEKLDSSIFTKFSNGNKYDLTEDEDIKIITNNLQLIDFEQYIQSELRRKAIKSGVFMKDPSSVFLSYDTEFDENVIIEPNVYFGTNVKLGKDVHIKAFSYIEEVTISENAIIGPYARVRGKSTIGEGVRIGNFVEIKNSNIGARMKAGHLTYIGDSNIDSDVNIGAGTITCNYDGIEKHRTEIGANSFIGANNLFIAPVTVGANSMIGAGCVIRENIPDKIFVSRKTDQKTKPNKREL